MSPAPVRWLDREPEEGARRLALGFLDQAQAARLRLHDAEDAEALHDFRVGLRRLRSTLRSYRDLLAEGIGRKLAKRLEALADSTGDGRDAEVALVWLEAQTDLPASARAGHRHLLEHLRGVRAWAYAEILERIERDFDALDERLRARLSIYRTEIRLDEEPASGRLGDAAADALIDLTGKLHDQLAAIQGPGDEAAAHRARISAKRTRYLLEPFLDELAAGRAGIKKLKRLQELLGDLHDAHVLERTLTEAAEKAGADRAHRLFDLALEGAPLPAVRAERRKNRESGIAELGRRNRARRDALYEEIQEGWLDARTARFTHQLVRVAEELRSAPIEEPAATATD